MKIHFDNVNIGAQSGPNTFAKRLAKCLFEKGHDVLLSAQNADISLIFIEPTGMPLAKKSVLRLDGIWFKPDEFSSKNIGIKNAYQSVDSVIFQSQFDQNMIEKWWGKRTLTSVIRNGAHQQHVRVDIHDLLKIREHHNKVFVCSSNWHPQKRLKANLELFDNIRKTIEPNSCLFVLGANPDVVCTDPNVYYTGSQPSEVYDQIFAVSDWMLHLAWLDHCPNVVIEALTQATPVICSSTGGTKELVQDYGIILQEEQYNYELCDYDNPPAIDVSSITRLPSKNELGQHANIDINAVTSDYIKVLEQVMKKQ